MGTNESKNVDKLSNEATAVEISVQDGNESHDNADEERISNDTNESMNIGTPSNGANNGKTNKSRSKILGKTCFSRELMKLEKERIVILDPVVIDKSTGKPYDKGLHVKCMVCCNYRPYSDGIISLRRPHYEYYFWNHCESKTHTTAKHVFDLKKKDDKDKKTKTYTQSMLTSFLVEKKRKLNSDNASTKTAVQTNEETNATNDNNGCSEEESNGINLRFVLKYLFIL